VDTAQRRAGIGGPIDDAYRDRTMTAVFSSVFAGHDVGVLVPVPKRPARISHAAARRRVRFIADWHRC
jgi:hypothetical protein